MKLARFIGILALLPALILNTPAAAQTAPPIEVYGDLPGIEDMALSPSGALAIATKIKGQRRLVVFGTDHAMRTSLALGDTKLRGIYWAGEDMVIATLSQTENMPMNFTTDKHEFFNAMMVPVDGSKVEAVFARNPDMLHAVFGNHGIRQIGGNWIGHFEGVELERASRGESGYTFEHGRPALMAYDFAARSKRRISRSANEGRWRDWLVDANGAVAAMLEITIDTGKWEITNAAGAVLASGMDKQGDVSLMALGYDGTSAIYTVEDDAAGETHYLEVPLAGGTPVPFLPDTGFDLLYVDPANGQVMGYLPDDGSNRPVLHDPARQAVLRKVYRAFPKLDMQVMEWTPSMSHVLVRTSGNGDSGTWYLVDMARMKAEPVGYERMALNDAQVGPISTFAYKAADGLDLDGVLTLPPGREAKNLPVILLPHGGPHSQDRPEFDWWAQAFASRGYAVFQPNFRGSTNRDEAFIRAGYGEWGRKMQTDISDGLAALASAGIVDPRRACIMGASYGGYAALAGVTLQQGLYRCAVAVAPVSDLREHDSRKYRESGASKMTRASMRESLGDPKNFDAVSPRRHAAQADAPILLIHGKDDTVVNYRHSTAMADALRDAGKPYEMITLTEEDHWLSRAATRTQMLTAALRFVQQYNPAD